ncbi:MAG: Magnesium-chelatase 38 kDa subunit [Syntrophaceae bacterium PtaU1.Bin231]|nr:MAG: Magnesium-chelatase 38 kDa subunit [Syntrophaceae bacterium PtaU1.Bin231]
MSLPRTEIHRIPFKRPLYPFSAIVGQARMKLALLLNAVDPAVGGVLIRGEKGTAKSTAARALAQLLPEIEVHKGCAFSCNPERPGEWCPTCRGAAFGHGPTVLRRRSAIVTLPLNATEDMLAGGLDFSVTMAGGTRAFQPGLLAKAHRGILYIDEVNLLDDHLVDIILDAAEAGVNIVEREGLSLRHAARFAIVASMNPEEGSLRPQLLDRFGLCVEVTSEIDPAERVQVIKKREAFEADPLEFCRSLENEEAALSERLARARELLPAVTLAPQLRKYISELAMSRHVAGHRADLVIERAAKGHAALEGRDTVDVQDILEVAEMALRHRSRDTVPPPSPENSGEENSQDRTHPPETSQTREIEEPVPPPETAVLPPQDVNNETERQGLSGPVHEDSLFGIGDVFKVKHLTPTEDRLARRGYGRRSRTRTIDKQGRYVRSRYHFNGQDAARDIAIDATLRAAAPYQISRRAATGRSGVVIRKQDWRQKVREKKIGSFILFVVDGSGSMGARGRMAASKGAVMSLLLDAYQKRDRLAMIGFRRREAALLLPPTSSVEVAGKLLREMPVGGRTPLSAALVKAHATLVPQLLKDPNLRPLVILITDGKTNVPLDERNRPLEEALSLAGHIGTDSRIRWIVVDTEARTGVRFGLARHIAAALGGEYYSIDDLKASHLVGVVKGL